MLKLTLIAKYYFSTFKMEIEIDGEKITVDREIGKGGFSNVYKVKRDDGNYYAMKKINLNISSRSHKKRIENEIRNQSMIKSDFVNRLISHHIVEGADIIFLELCENGSLKNVSRFLFKGNFDNIFTQILRGIKAIHSKRIIHRDIKPENIYFNGNTIKIGDFGLSEYVEDPSEELYQLCGTPYFMAPEMLKSTGYLFPVDIWSFGIMVYNILYGKFPFTSESKNFQELGRKIIDDDIDFEDYIDEDDIDDLVFVRGKSRILKRILNKDGYSRPSASDLLRFMV